MTKNTLSLSADVLGNPLFMRACMIMDVDMSAAKVVLTTVLAKIGVTPKTVTLDDLGALLPDIERELRRLLPDDKAASSVAKFRNFLLTAT